MVNCSATSNKFANVNSGTYSIVLVSCKHSSSSIRATVSFPVMENADDVVVSSPST